MHTQLIYWTGTLTTILLALGVGYLAAWYE